ncbi:hypothetical protein [Crenalkalicoccus roseus]|uniref:hypothetical protein n=1 Tax=Crenalkalicoccus roseus TaxID=1485588 RepID=UPI0010815F4D|nr:hypothetical protein [Crenalkalicoccus roseus]
MTSALLGGALLAAGPAVSGLHPGYVPGLTYWAARGQLAAPAAVAAADVLLGYPFLIGAPVRIAALHLRVGTGGAGSSAKAGVWRMSGGRPAGTPVAAHAAGTPTTANNQTVEMPATGLLLPGWHFFGAVFTGTLPSCVGPSGNSAEIAWLIGGTPAQMTATPVSGLSTPFAFGGDLAALALDGAAWTAVTAGVPALGFTVA